MPIFDPNQSVEDMLAQEQANTGGYTGTYGPLFDPGQLLTAGVPETLVGAYSNAARAYAQIQAAAIGSDDPATRSAMAQAHSSLRALENQITKFIGTSSTSSQGKYITDKYGNQVLMPPAVEPPGGVGPLPQPRIAYEDPSAGLARQQDEADLDYKRRLAANVGAPPQRAPQTQAEMDADAARARLYAAQATGAERDLQNPYILKQQQVAETIQSIQEQMARGEITPDEGNKMMLLARQNLDAAMRGTTPYQMENDRLTREQTRRTQQQNLAQNFVADRAQMSGSMATGLLSGLGGIYGKIYSSTNPPAIDPFALASGYTDQAYGGPELNDMALALLRSALGQGGM